MWIKNIPRPSASGAGTKIHIASLNTLNNLVIGENGNAFAAGSWNFFETPRLVSFNLSSGAPNWAYDSPFGTPDDPVTWLGANVTQVASLSAPGLPFGMPFVLQSSPPIGLQGVTAVASTLVDAVLGMFPAPSPSGDEGESCARLDEATGKTLAAAYSSLKTFLSNINNCLACDSKIFNH